MAGRVRGWRGEPAPTGFRPDRWSIQSRFQRTSQKDSRDLDILETSDQRRQFVRARKARREAAEWRVTTQENVDGGTLSGNRPLVGAFFVLWHVFVCFSGQKGPSYRTCAS